MPVGYAWVIRDIVLVSPGGPGIMPIVSSGSIAVNGIPVVETPKGGTLAGYSFRWSDLRQVVLVSDAWGFHALEANWQIRVAGYQLTTP